MEIQAKQNHSQADIAIKYYGNIEQGIVQLAKDNHLVVGEELQKGTTLSLQESVDFANERVVEALRNEEVASNN